MQKQQKRSRFKALAAAPWFALLAMAGLALSPFGVTAARAADPTVLLTWNKLAPATSPPARLHGAMALDSANGTTVLFGGRAGSQVLADTWTWDGAAWTAKTPASSPPALESASMAYDNIGHQVLLFGGISSDGNATSDTWSWNGTTWTKLAPTSVPPPRYAASIASDSVTGAGVLFGGLSSPGSSLADTWSWDGANWVPATPTASPPARSGAAMTFDATRGVVVLFGGATGSDNRADTWTWDGTNWTQQNPAASPPARNDAALAFDTATQTAILFGGSGGNQGNTPQADTWLWNGSTWSTTVPLAIGLTLSPPARTGASIALAPAGQRLVLFGGQSAGSTPAVLGDTWSVATIGSTVPQTPSTTTPGTSTDSTSTVAGVTTSTTTTAGTSSATTTDGQPATSTPTKLTPARASLGVSSRSFHRGQQMHVSGSGFLPGAKITITFHSATTVVGTTTADSNGRFSTTILVPSDAPIGQHHIEADGATDRGAQTVLVAQVSVMAPGGSHHSWLLPALMVALTVLLAGGAGVMLTTSSRWQRVRPGD